MAPPEKSSRDVETCRYLLQGAAKNLADRLYGAQGPPWGTPFADLERTALGLAGALRQTFLQLLLSRQATAFRAAPPAEHCRCPSCSGDTLEAEPEPRVLFSRAGDAEWLEPQRYCRKCRKAFFPQSKGLGLDLGHYSASLLDLICYAGANKPSFREASLDLDKLGGARVHEKQVERLCKRIGGERLAERDAQVAHFQGLPLVERLDGAPPGVVPPGPDQVAVIMADAGMMQLRHPPDEVAAAAGPQTTAGSPADALGGGAGDEAGASGPGPAAAAEEDDPDQDKPPTGRHWHEDKVGLVLTMRSATHDRDPCPLIPPTFLDADRVAKIVRGLKKSATLSAEDQGEPAEGEGPDPAADEEAAAAYEGPKLERRQVVASRKNWPAFATLLAAAAWLAGLARAPRKAFVADGARAIWRAWRTRFSSYVPILDFIHAMSYVYAAAKAVGQSPGAGWSLYAEWITWTWQGQVGRVIEALQRWQEQHGKPAKGEAKTSAASVVARSLGYLRNNQSKMKYDEYRKQGLPIVSSLVESMVKQISRRVKGTEKFWGEEGAEAILQLRADYLSDGDGMEHFWERRQAAATGQRIYRTAA